jgi:hypothetical protein
MKKKLGCVYFAKQKSNDGYIKIGFSVNIITRQATLQTASAYIIEYLALLVEETQTTEHLIHTMLHSSKIRGEWFYPTPEVMECIEYVMSGRFKEYVEKYVNIGKARVSYLEPVRLCEE